MSLTLTENAAEHLRELLAAKNASPDEQGLRLYIEKGGCAGMNYAMKIDAPADSDEIVEKNGVRVFVDADSLPYLQGAEVDYVDALNDAGFKIQNPNAARSCGCGTSFEPANKSGDEPAYDPETMDGTACKD
ncbi:MAG: iron-sulfur cluster assembly accessory protein [Verrucomicrobiae bacterium]|nr:iron-sulfur cluster assembly accessory protein [Verrucomicrobiae bacterium]